MCARRGKRPDIPDALGRIWKEILGSSIPLTSTNVIFLGPSGTEKNHLSLALADTALQAGHSVLFTTFADLATALESASHPGILRSRLCRYITPSLLVIDEVGYTKLTETQAKYLFDLVSARNEHGSILLTSNTSFAQWGHLFGDDVLVMALLDRLLHHAEVIAINRPSYRMRERQISLVPTQDEPASEPGSLPTGMKKRGSKPIGA